MHVDRLTRLCHSVYARLLFIIGDGWVGVHLICRPSNQRQKTRQNVQRCCRCSRWHLFAQFETSGAAMGQLGVVRRVTARAASEGHVGSDHSEVIAKTKRLELLYLLSECLSTSGEKRKDCYYCSGVQTCVLCGGCVCDTRHASCTLRLTVCTV